MTTDQIERTTQQITDTLDSRYMNFVISKAEYRRKMAALARWEDRQFAKATK
jgi:hypothetical protein